LTNPTNSTSEGNLPTEDLPPKSPSTAAGLARNISRYRSRKDEATDSSLQSIVEDVNNISVTPSTVTNMTVDDDDWSMGSMFSFRKKRQQQKAARQQQAKLKPRSVLDKHLSNPNDYNEVSMWRSNKGRIVASGERRSEKHQLPAMPMDRKVSFDNGQEINKAVSKKLGQVSYYQKSPREKSRFTEHSDATNPPTIEFDDAELRWKIKNHIATESCVSSNVVLTIHVRDANERVLITNCHGVSVQIHGRKMKSLLIGDCSDVSVVFDTVTHACEVIHCKSTAIQTTGICPGFAIERSKGVTIWLSHESMKLSNVVTSKCTEVTVSLPKGPTENDYDRKELTLPERFVHQFNEGEVKSRVSSVCR
jgi:hypothetical protein